MISLTTYASRITSEGGRLLRVEIQATEKPEPMPETGEGIEGMPDNAKIDAGSIMKVLANSETYIKGDDGEWYKQEGAK